MHKSPIYNYSFFEELPLATFDEQRFAVYILDKNWKYLFVNAFAYKNLKLEAKDLIGKNMWDVFEEYKTDPTFLKLKKEAESKISSSVVTVSPVTGQRISILSYSLMDCYYFAASILPDKNALIDEKI